MNLHSMLSTLADRLLSHPPLQALGIAHTQVWDGAWHALADPNRIALPTPAALVSMTALRDRSAGPSRGTSRASSGRSRPETPRARLRPIRKRRASRHALQARVDVAVAFVSSEPDSEKRAQAVVDLVEAAIPVLIDFALQDIRGSSLYTPALHTKGLAAFVLMGRRDIESRPDQPPELVPSLVRYVEDDDCEDVGVIIPGQR